MVAFTAYGRGATNLLYVFSIFNVMSQRGEVSMSMSAEAMLSGDAISAALDPHRRRSVEGALEKVLGAGGGAKTVALLGFQAATFFDTVAQRAGKVVLVENRPGVVERLQRAVVSQKLGDKVKLVDADPAKVSLDQRVDVAMYLPQSTWMMESPDAAILANIRTQVLKEGGALIPRRVVQLLELAAPPTDLAGVSLRQTRYSRPGEPVALLSESKQFMVTEFGSVEASSDEVDDTIIIRPLVGGVVKGLRLSSLVELADGVIQASSEAGVKSILVPLREDVKVEAGQPLSIRVRYQPGAGLASARFSARIVADGEETPPVEADHPVVVEFQKKVRQYLTKIDQMGRGSDLDRVVSYTRRPHGDVSRLTALFWAVDEEFRRPLREMIDQFRREASEALGQMPGDEATYDWMLAVYEEDRAGEL